MARRARRRAGAALGGGPGSRSARATERPGRAGALLRSAGRAGLLLALALGAAGWARASAAPDESAAELARRIQKERDDVDPAVFERLAGLRTEESFQALKRALGRLRGEEALCAATWAMRHYAGAEEAEGDALEHLRRQAGRRGPEAPRRRAVETIAQFGARAAEALEGVLDGNTDPGCRALAADALAPALLARGEREALEKVLAHATLSAAPAARYVGLPEEERAALEGRPHRDVVRERLLRVEGEAARALFAARLAAADASRAWKLLLVELLARDAGAEASGALVAALGDEDPAVALACLDALKEREEVDGYEDALRRLLRSGDATLRRRAIVSLAWLRRSDADVHAEVLELSRSSDAPTRMGALAALARYRTVEAAERVAELLEDPEWAVRVEALEAAARMRRAAVVPALIERLRFERGRMRQDVHGALRMLTGLDHGRSPERWAAWWAREGEAFEPPPPEAALAAEAERRARDDDAGTAVASFYGVHVVSERVVFVLDVSGSMRLPPGVFDEAADYDPSLPSRMDIARKELSAAVRGMPDGTLFNLIFFEDEVHRLDDDLVEMKKRERQRALRWISEQYALGGTALYPALQLAFRDPLVDTIHVLTDGAPTVGELTDIAAIRAEVARWNEARHVRIHGVALGQDSTLLRWLAEDTGGRYARVD